MSWLALLLLSLLGAAILGFAAYRTLSQWPRGNRIIAAASFPVIVILAALVMRFMFYELLSDWNAARLAPAIALRLGFPLYSGAETGPVLTIYPPVSAFVYRWATYADTLTTALLLGGLTSLVFFFGRLNRMLKVV